MILPDVNVLLYAAHRDFEQHRAYAEWLTTVLAGPEEVGLADLALTGCLRVLTSSRVFADPFPPGRAVDFVTALRAARASRPVGSSAATWDRFGLLVTGDPGIRGNLVPDAWLAALALSHGARLATADRGFGRFPGLQHFDPLS